ncbi:NRAMP family divalent metal transporter [Deminuibacter soli]|uniref:Divalent metal cation transporter n=1 Tax=Deminuibacter soli TaxID=2291815 RepID=A0A3E1NFV5_9BACT|nr:divalent metal cation transporter [Deminuibacter soli]RFM26849.1 divalent metal cation transporter [Deminuibacter soli]
MKTNKSQHKGLRHFFKILGPGLVTGAGDDDPSGIATYSQAGAQFGLATLWTALITFPLMASIQGMCARIGLVTCEGLTHTLKHNYSKFILYLMLVFSVPATVLNIGSDIAGMGAVSHLLLPKVPAYLFCIVITALLMFAIVQFPYQKISSILKWLCLSMLLYIIVPFLIKPDWGSVLRNTFVPTIHFDKDFIQTLVAILGTTISPYLFFWQTTMEAEDQQHKPRKLVVSRRVLSDMKQDVNTGMFASNLVMFFIILTTGVVLHGHIKQIDTVEQAAKALEPLAGKMSYALFAVGVLGTGFLAIPILAGSLSYIVSETFGWSQGLDKKYYEAKGFYAIILLSLGVGLAINFVGLSPMKALVYTAILYGVTAPVMIAVILHICNNPKIMQKHTNGTLSNILGFTTLVVMTAAAVTLIYFQVKGK